MYAIFVKEGLTTEEKQATLGDMVKKAANGKVLPDSIIKLLEIEFPNSPIRKGMTIKAVIWG
ncbi:hypothetical protein ACFL6M_02515 [Candidatus Eisenbacteria bacterium]|uniref:4-oxalocrotonate tautomerase n=1 Tax=Eiseniibacteriota bacterium TaxID=2212470 RepID=A0ABV6YJD5_UNCEI